MRCKLTLALTALAGCLALASPLPAHAVPIEIDLTISMPNPPPIFQNLLLSGQPTFYKAFPSLDFPPTMVGPSPPPIDIGKGGTYHFSLIPTDPCFGAGVCQLDFSFLNGLTGAFPTLAFLSTDTIPSVTPTPPPILPIGTLQPSDPCRDSSAPGDPCRAFGNIVAYDAPAIIGSFDITVRAVPEPGSALLLISGLIALAGLGRRQRRRASTAGSA